MSKGGNKETARPARPDEIVLELMKQLITLSAGVLALSATFLQRLGDVSIILLSLLALSWLALTAALYFGLQTIAAVVEARMNEDQSENDLPEDVKKRSLISKYGFLAGIILFAAFAFASLITAKQSGSPPQVNIVNEKSK